MEKDNAVSSLIRAEIQRDGPISFERFMEMALYTPGLGYYTRPQDPFGRAGDFFTAEQIQPVFGSLIAAIVRSYRTIMGDPYDFRVVELGPGRREMAEHLAEFSYTGVDVGDEPPSDITGILFANEFFDALPVQVTVRRPDAFREVRVALHPGGRFVFVDADPIRGSVAEYLERYHPDAPEGSFVEVNLRALEWARRMRSIVARGFAIVIDYGYTVREWSIRHIDGTLMRYRKHIATDDVLADPGESDNDLRTSHRS